MADEKDKKLYSYKEALEQPNWVRRFGSFFTFSSAFKFSRIVYTAIVSLVVFIILSALPFLAWNYNLIFSFVLGLLVAFLVEDLKIDGRLFVFFFKDYLLYYFTYGVNADKIYINKGKVYQRLDNREDKDE